jgi:hypothetical protein
MEEIWDYTAKDFEVPSIGDCYVERPGFSGEYSYWKVVYIGIDTLFLVGEGDRYANIRMDTLERADCITNSKIYPLTRERKEYIITNCVSDNFILKALIPDDFDDPLPEDIQKYFDGEGD